MSNGVLFTSGHGIDDGASHSIGNGAGRNGFIPRTERFPPRTARAILDSPQSRDRDPSSVIPGGAPNFGQWILPQVMTVQGLVHTVARTYRASDEALQHSWANARYMRNDVGIMECVEARQRSVALLNWHIEPEDDTSLDQRELATAMTQVMQRIPNFLKLRECLLHAVWFGKYGTQQLYRWRRVGGSMRVIPVRWLPIHGDKLVFRIEDDTCRDTDEVGIRVGLHNQVDDVLHDNTRKVELVDVGGFAYFLDAWERELICVHKHQIEDGDYQSPMDAGKIHGVGIRSKIYWDWFQKQELLGFLMEYLERAAFGIELWYYPWGNAQAKADAEQAAQNRTANGRSVVLVPRPAGEDAAQYGVEHIEPGLGGVDALKSILSEYYGHRIKRYILGQTLTSEADATGLGSGVAEIHLGTFMDIVRYDATNLEETITNDLLRPLQKWNFPLSQGVHLKFKIDTESQDAQGKLQAFKAAWDMGARIKESDVLDQIGAAMPTEKDHVLVSPAAPQQQAQQQAIQQQQMMMDAQKQQAAAGGDGGNGDGDGRNGESQGPAGQMGQMGQVPQ